MHIIQIPCIGNKKTGFTLAEVLITIAIIGVVAALTIPTLISNWQNQAFATMIKKASYEFSSAVDMFITEEGKTSIATTSIFDSDGLDKFMQAKFKVVKSCTTFTDCFAPAYFSINGTSDSSTTCTNSYILADGSAICVTLEKTQTEEKINVKVDVNGAKGPNIGGRDMFEFFINRDGKLEAIAANESNCKASATGNACFNLLRENNFVMNY